MKFLYLFSFIIWFSISNSYSQDTVKVASLKEIVNLSLEELMNVEVYGTLRTYSQKSSTAPATVRVITQKQIRERGYRSILDVLQDMPDVKVDFGVDPRWMHDITIRGIRYMDKFLILLNGVEISSPTNDIISIMENYPVNFAKQVEIIFGPASALYGADAFSGIINIITEQDAEETITRFSMEGGTHNLINGNFYLQKELTDDFSLSLGGQLFYDQQPDLSDYYPELYVGMDRELETGIFNNTILGDDVSINPDARVEPQKVHELMSYGFYSGFNYKGFKFTYFGNYGRNPSSMANSPANSVYNKDQYFGHSINMVSLSYEKQINNFKSLSTISYSRYDLDSRSNFRNIWVNMEPAYLFAYGWMAKAEQLISYEFSDKLKLTGGITFEQFESMPRSNDLHFPVFGKNPDGIIVNSIASNNPDGISANLVKTNFYNAGGLLQGQYTFDFPLTITGGIRIDNDERFGVALNPRLGMVYETDHNYTIKTLYGTAFLAPSPQYMYDRFGTFQTDDNGTTYYSYFYQLPNENLEPQKIQTVELSFLKYLTTDLSVKLTGYSSVVTGLISPVSDTLGSENHTIVDELYPDFLYPGTDYPIQEIQVNDNIGKSIIYGGNIIFDYKKNFTNKLKTFATLSYSYIEGMTDIDENGPYVERELPGISNHTLKLRGTLNWNDISFSLGLIAMSNQRVINYNAVEPDGDDNSYNNDTYKTLPGYTLINSKLAYQITQNFEIYLKGTNLLDQRYYNVNIGAASPEAGLGSAAAEFTEGAPQNPIRIMTGFRIVF